MKPIKSFFVYIKPRHGSAVATPEELKGYLRVLLILLINLYCVVLLVATCSIVGCATVEYVPVPLDLPDRPILPTVKSTELQCLSDDVYTRLVQRDRLQHGHIEVLEAVIVSTQP